MCICIYFSFFLSVRGNHILWMKICNNGPFSFFRCGMDGFVCKTYLTNIAWPFSSANPRFAINSLNVCLVSNVRAKAILYKYRTIHIKLLFPGKHVTSAWLGLELCARFLFQEIYSGKLQATLHWEATGRKRTPENFFSPLLLPSSLVPLLLLYLFSP